MKQATVRQLRQDFPQVLKWIQQGEEVQILRRRRVVARLSPEPSDHREVELPDFLRRLEWVCEDERPLTKGDLEEIIESERGRW